MKAREAKASKAALVSEPRAWLARLGLAKTEKPVTSDEPASPTHAHAASTWWHVKVREQVYGPYSLEDFASYIAEGRISRRTYVSEFMDTGFRPAGTIAELVEFFPVVQSEVEAGPSASQAATTDTRADPALTNYFIWADIVSGMGSVFERQLEMLGRSTRIGQTLWVLRSRKPMAEVRNSIATGLHRGDRAVIADCTRDRLAWINLGPEADVRIKDVWSAPRL